MHSESVEFTYILFVFPFLPYIRCLSPTYFPMAPGPPRPTIRVVHPTVGLQTLENLVLPVMINVAHGEWLQRRIIFCTVYDALLDDVQALDRTLESRFSREIIRIVSNFATSFDLQNQDIPETQKFSQRIRSLGHKCQQPAAVQGLSGGTVLDYLVSLIAEKSRVKLDTVCKMKENKPLKRG